MSTRANIVLKDQHEKLFFYRHNDGNPEVTRDESLSIFMDWLNRGLISSDVGQASGWLIIIGANEDDYYWKNQKCISKNSVLNQYNPTHIGWKVGAYEPTTGIHGDVEWVYEINLVSKTLTTYRPDKYPN